MLNQASLKLKLNRTQLWKFKYWDPFILTYKVNKDLIKILIIIKPKFNIRRQLLAVSAKVELYFRNWNLSHFKSELEKIELNC